MTESNHNSSLIIFIFNSAPKVQKKQKAFAKDVHAF